jgi:uncharacterized protein (DUF1800 family)
VRRSSIFAIAIVVLMLMTSSCALTPGGYTPPVGDTLTISPSTADVRAGSTQQFTPSITTKPLTWLVNGVAGGSTASGLIDANGNYTAPATLPSPNSVTIEAEESSKNSVNSSSAVTLWNPIPQISNISPASLNVGNFTLTITGSNFVSGATVSFGGANLTTTFVSSTQLTAAGTASAAQVGAVAVDVANPDPGASPSNGLNAEVIGTITIPAAPAARFAEHTTFGPTPAVINQIQIQGLQNFLNAQYTAPVTPYPDPLGGETSLGPLQQRYWVINLTAQDQLRQRVALALSYIWVIGGDKVSDPNGYTNWLRLLDSDAFSNYRKIMYDVTVSPAMGHWLDMVNNGKPNVAAGDHANENYAREAMQLFTLGTGLLNPDGSPQLDATNLPIPTYSQDQVEAFARAYTGWTYPLTPGNTQQTYNPSYWIGPMVPVDSNHDMGTKQLLTYPGAAGGGLLPAGQSSVQDLNGALDNIFNHPNIGPFVCRQLIQHLVTSNPSPAYVQRVAAVFANNGSGVRGDMKSVITAILMDSEARRGDDPATAVGTDGHLQDPILLISGVMRAFGATTDGSNLSYYAGNMGENPLFSPSVFNFYAPNYVVPGTTNLGPEFQILTTATSLNRVNWVNTFAFGNFGGESVDFSSWAAQASNPGAMVDALNALLLHGSMSSDMKTAIVTAVQAVPAGSTQASRQAQAAIYLVTSSSQYQVRH